MPKRRILALTGLFLLFEFLVWAFALRFLAETNWLLFGLVLSACGVTVLLVHVMIGRMQARTAPAAPDVPRADAPPRPRSLPSTLPSNDDDRIMASLVAEANGRLAKSPALSSRRSDTPVNRLPLYLLLGAEGAGKTSAFAAADISAELLAGDVFRESSITPTHTCNLWFAGGALVVEPAGRFLREGAPPLSWLLGFFRKTASQSRLRRIFSFRNSGENLKGVFLCCDINDFLGMPDIAQCATRQAALARRWQACLADIGKVCRIDFPVYVIFTKCDRIPYFQQYFARLTESEDRQILGATLPSLAASERTADQDYSGTESERLSAAFNGLYYSLAGKRMAFLPREFDRAQKPMVYEFPRELKKLRGAVVQFLVDMFRPNPLEAGAMLRGFYFAGVRQVAAPGLRAPARDRAAQRFGEATRLFQGDELRAAIGIGTIEETRGEPEVGPPDTPVRRWAFVTQVFSQSIVHDRGAAGAVYVDKRVEEWRRIGLIAACSLVLILCVLFFSSWSRNRALLRDLEDAALDCRPLAAGQHGFPSPRNLQQIDRLRTGLATLIDYGEHGAPWGMRFGLYSGKRLLEPLTRIYFDRFRNYFLDRIIDQTSVKLASLRPSDNPPFSYETIYNDLKSYRSISNAPGEPVCKPDKPFPVWLLDTFRSGHELDPESQAIAARNLDFYARELESKHLPVAIDGRADSVSAGRRYLNQFGGEQRIYRAILEEVNKAVGRPARLADYAPRYSDVLTGPFEVDADFSVAGRDKILDRIRNVNGAAIGESCVLGATRVPSAQSILQGAALESKIRNLYVTDYIAKWRDFLEESRLIPYRGAADASRKLKLLQDNDSPLLGLLFMVNENTIFPSSGKSAAATAAVAAAPTLVDRFSWRLGRVGRTAQAARNATRDLKPLEQPRELSVDDIRNAFQPVHELFTADADRNRWTGDKNRAWLQAVTEMQRSMDALAQSSSADTDVALNSAANKAMLDGLDKVKVLSEAFVRNPENTQNFVERLLTEPFEANHPWFVTDFGKAAAKKLDGAFAPVCAHLNPLLKKYPFNAAGSVDAAIDEVSGVFSPLDGSLWTFYQKNLATLLVKQGHRYTVRPDAPAGPKIDPEFLVQLNRLALITEALYPEGGASPRMLFRLSPLPDANLSGMALTIGGDRMANGPKVFSWPGAAGSHDLVLMAKLGEADVPFASYPGLWSVFRMMADADVRSSGSRIVGLTNLSHGSSRPHAVLDKDGNPITVRLEIEDFPGGVETAFDKNFFTQLRCPSKVSGQ